MPDTLRRIAWPLVALACLVIASALLTPGFFAIHVRDGRLHGTIVDVLFNGTRVMLLALPMTLVIATRGVDLSVGAVMALSGAAAAVLVNQQQPLAVALLASFGIAAAAGLMNGLLVARAGLQPIVATLVLMVAGRGVAQSLAGAPIVPFSSPALRWFASGQMLGVPVAVWFVAAAFIAFWLLTRRTALGLMIEALGDNPAAAREVGIPVATIKTCVYVLSALCAALAGLIDAAAATSADTYNSGLNLELDAILAVVIGGTALIGGRFLLAGSLLGAVVIQLLTTMLLQHDLVNANQLTLPKAVLVIAVCVLQSPRLATWWRAMAARRSAQPREAA
ncbi:MAG: ABC transporter permease [Phycisphaerales bacterium]